MPTRSMTRPEVKPWILTTEERAEVEALNATSLWLRCPPDPKTLMPYRGKYVAARDCKIIAAADTLDALYRLLEMEKPGSYMIAYFGGGGIKIIPK